MEFKHTLHNLFSQGHIHDSNQFSKNSLHRNALGKLNLNFILFNIDQED